MDFQCFGEPLAEFTSNPKAPGRFDRRAGGDMLNTAVYLARLTAPGSVGHLSRLGDDAMSGFLRSTPAEEGIAVLCSARAGGRPGLGFITTDPQGERSITYWRDQSPARRLFSCPDELAALDRAGTLVLSGVTLAMLLPDGRTSLLAALERRRVAGARIVFRVLDCASATLPGRDRCCQYDLPVWGSRPRLRYPFNRGQWVRQDVGPVIDAHSGGRLCSMTLRALDPRFSVKPAHSIAAIKLSASWCAARSCEGTMSGI